MTSSTTVSSRQKRLGSIALLVICVVFLLLRFVHLSADFPLGITWSGVLFTDEGWYASAALRQFVSGSWYQAGDFNPATIMPLGHVLHSAVFSIFGTGLSSVRITVVLCFVLLVVATALLVRRHCGVFVALLTSLFLVTNYTVFAYSRLAVMELVATSFVVFGLLAAQNYKGKATGLLRLLLAAVLIALGVLAKNTMVFAVPLLGYLAWQGGKGRKVGLAFLCASTLLTLSLVGGFQLVARLSFPEDVAYFAELNFDARRHESVWHWLLHIPRAVYGVKALGTGFAVLSAAMTVIALVLSSRYRRHPLVHTSAAFIVCYIAVLSLIDYSPPRYYVPLIVPCSILFALSCVVLRESLSRSKWRAVSGVSAMPLVIALVLAFAGGWKIVSYLSGPSYSFQQMAQEVGSVVKEREGDVSDVMLLGHIADSVSLESGTLPINTVLGVRSLDWKLRTYRPQYWIAHTDEEVLEAIEANGGRVVELASWDVYGNYYGTGQQVKLMHILWDR